MGIARAIGKAIIDRLAPSGLGTNALIRIVRSQGYGYNTKKMGEDIRSAQGRVKYQYFIEKLNNNELISESLMVQKDLGYPAKYRVFGNFTYYDPIADDYYTEIKSMYTNDYAKKGAWQDEWWSDNAKKYEFNGVEPISFNITFAERNTTF
jgi:hypothetical protein